MEGILTVVDQHILSWEAFIDRQELLPAVNPVVADSWMRCYQRLNPNNKDPLKHLSNEHLLASQVAGFDLFSIARPVMEDIYQCIERSDSVVVLTNRAGFILDVLGDPEMLDLLQEFGIFPGTSIAESEMGTNAIWLSLFEGVPIRVVGAEHYLSRFHELADAAAPIFDPSGRPLGALGVITTLQGHHAHTLGLVVAGARAIEGQRQSDLLLIEQNNQLTQLRTILATNSEGILVLDAERMVKHVNPAAVNILGLSEQVLVGRRISEYITYPDFLTRAVDELIPLTDVEVNIDVNGRPMNVILSLRYVAPNADLQSIVCTIRQIKDVRRLVHSQVGAYATLKLEDIPGTSTEMRRVRRFIKAAAAARASILIRGEVGTGKNLVASAIHNMSTYREGPFMIFACSSVPGELVVSELSGVDERATSNLPGGRPSKFELANNGTLYFQDVDALPLEAQGILLNLIDLGIVQRLGSNRPISVNVRVIASSSANIEKLISQGNFRSDLFYRLSAFEITTPPLRERPEDLAEVSRRIMRRLSRQLNRQLDLDSGVIEVLKNYSWPGNIRELEAVLGRATVQAGFSGIIEPKHLPDYIRFPKKYPDGFSTGIPIKSFEEIEREAIMRAAEICHGNATEMARLLGVGRTTIWRRLKTFGISLDQFKG